MIRSVGIFGSHLPNSRCGSSRIHHLMNHLKEHGVTKIVYGGSGSGTGQIIADAAKESGMAEIVGITSADLSTSSKYPRSEFLTRLISTEGYGAEKDFFQEECDAFVVLPFGGGGTISEITSLWEQNFIRFFFPQDNKQILLKPIILLNLQNSWESFRDLLLDKIYQGHTPIHHQEIFTFLDELNFLPTALRYWDMYNPMISKQFSNLTQRYPLVLPSDDGRRESMTDNNEFQLFTPYEFKRRSGFVERQIAQKKV